MLNQAKTPDLAMADEPARQMSVLILDDNEVDRKRIRRLCKDAGLNITVTDVSSLAEMEAALECKQFDIVFIDHLLVGENGLDAVDLLMSHPEQVAASIMIAGESRLDVALEAMRRGCSDFLVKSALNIETLQKSVAMALERRIMGLALKEERRQRQKLEQSVRLYANACSMEMRTILAGTLRRVRKLRSQQMTEEHASQLGDLEASIDRLWETLPVFGEKSKQALSATEVPRALPPASQ